MCGLPVGNCREYGFVRDVLLGPQNNNPENWGRYRISFCKYWGKFHIPKTPTTIDETEDIWWSDATKDINFLSANNYIISKSFMQRRKTLSNVLINNNIMHSKEDVKNMWKELKIDENVRGESLTLEQFGKIADYISEKK